MMNFKVDFLKTKSENESSQFTLRPSSMVMEFKFQKFVVDCGFGFPKFSFAWGQFCAMSFKRWLSIFVLNTVSWQGCGNWSVLLFCQFAIMRVYAHIDKHVTLSLAEEAEPGWMVFLSWIWLKSESLAAKPWFNSGSRTWLREQTLAEVYDFGRQGLCFACIAHPRTTIRSRQLVPIGLSCGALQSLANHYKATRCPKHCPKRGLERYPKRGPKRCPKRCPRRGPKRGPKRAP